MVVFVVLSCLCWALFVLMHILIPQSVQLSGLPIKSPVLRGIMAFIAVPIIGYVLYWTGWFIQLGPTALLSLF